MQNGFVQFKDESGKVVTTNGSLSLIQDGSRNLTFYGSRGKSELSGDEYKAVIEDIGYTVPVPVASYVSDDDDDTDFTLPC
jgi:hypothetical protein